MTREQTDTLFYLHDGWIIAMETMKDAESGEEQSDRFVVVSIAPNGIVHVWGDDNSNAFHDRRTAQHLASTMIKIDHQKYPRGAPVIFKVCKILGQPLQGPREELA